MAGRAWFDAKARRRLQIVLYLIAIVAAVLLALILVGAIVFRSGFSPSDQLSAVNDVLAGAALFLALAAGLITLQSFAAATGIPEVRVEAWFGADRAGDLVVVAERGADGTLRSVEVPGQARLNVRLENTAAFDAVDPIVSISCQGLLFAREMDERTNGWHVVDAHDGRGAVMAEWVGDAPLHRRAARRLPTLDLVSIIRERNAPAATITVRVTGVGYLQDFPIPVRFVEARPGEL
jgi:hypothetical protein